MQIILYHFDAHFLHFITVSSLSRSGVSPAMGVACNACSNAVLSLACDLAFRAHKSKVLHLSCSSMVLNIYLQSAKRVILCVLRNL